MDDLYRGEHNNTGPITTRFFPPKPRLMSAALGFVIRWKHRGQNVHYFTIDDGAQAGAGASAEVWENTQAQLHKAA